jgi:hypothetical protein
LGFLHFFFCFGQVLLATTKLELMELKLAMAVKPDDPAGPMRQAKLNLTLNPKP